MLFVALLLNGPLKHADAHIRHAPVCRRYRGACPGVETMRRIEPEQSELFTDDVTRLWWEPAASSCCSRTWMIDCFSLGAEWLYCWCRLVKLYLCFASNFYVAPLFSGTGHDGNKSLDLNSPIKLKDNNNKNIQQIHVFSFFFPNKTWVSFRYLLNTNNSLKKNSVESFLRNVKSFLFALSYLLLLSLFSSLPEVPHEFSLIP